MKKIAISVIGAIASYSVLPTILFRTFSQRIIKTTKEKGILLTFDDGPNPLYTDQLLTLLKTHHLKAVFFVVAEKAQRFPELIQRIQDEGHVIGIHHYTHRSSALLTPQQLQWQLDRSQQVLTTLTGQKIIFYRPPYGHFNAASLHVANSLHTVTWSAIFGDWKTKTCQTTLLSDLHANRQDGAIYVLHDCGQNRSADDEAPRFMLQILTQFLEEALGEGQQFVDAQQWATSYV